jgi:hypothetical protein
MWAGVVVLAHAGVGHAQDETARATQESAPGEVTAPDADPEAPPVVDAPPEPEAPPVALWPSPPAFTPGAPADPPPPMAERDILMKRQSVGAYWVGIGLLTGGLAGLSVSAVVLANGASTTNAQVSDLLPGIILGVVNVVAVIGGIAVVAGDNPWVPEDTAGVELPLGDDWRLRL